MPFSKSYDETDVAAQPACAMLRSKRLFVTGEIDSPHPDEADDSHCWCNLPSTFLVPTTTWSTGPNACLGEAVIASDSTAGEFSVAKTKSPIDAIFSTSATQKLNWPRHEYTLT